MGERATAGDRRTFLRRLSALAGGATLGGLAGCTGELPTAGSTETDDAGTPAGAPPLAAGMELGVLFTAFGGQTTRSTIDPDEPGGGRLVAVQSVEAGERVTVAWRETVEREVTPSATDDAGVGTATPTPKTEIVERSGTLTATGLAEVHEPLLPMYWDAGKQTTDTSAMWLSRTAYRELVETQETTWTADVLTRISWVGKEVQERIHEGANQVDEVVLEADPTFVDVDLVVDGTETTVRTVEAHDSFGNEYVILADEANPLVVKFTYDAVSVGFSGFDTAVWSLIKAVFSGYEVVSVSSA